MATSSSIFWSVAALVTCVKLLLIPSYRSTDFEVHRNWLAITHNRPVYLWYYEETSEWTLDYPPFFAWFEYGLSHIAKFVDVEMLKLSNFNYASERTILFQRLSVIITDFIFIYAIRLCVEHFTNGKRRSNQSDLWLDKGTIMTILLLWNTGLILVDHIHFQYNGFLMGLWFLSIVKILQRKHLQGAFWFAVLLNFKHIYLYTAPVYFVYLLRSYCLQVSGSGFSKLCSFSKRLIQLGTIVIAVFSISFGPFIYMGQLRQLLSRLFPFGRGLTHAYWAPNFWALYNTADKALYLLYRKLDMPVKRYLNTEPMTGGLVQTYNHSVLPSITPSVTLILTISSIVPALITLWRRPNQPIAFLRCLVICAMSSFMFGWHVHEKAIILVVLPLTLLALVSRQEASVYLMLSTVGHVSLFPLIFTSFETPIKLLLLCSHAYYGFCSLSKHYRSRRSFLSLPLLNMFETIYIIGLIPVQLFFSFGLPLLKLEERFPFLPLMMFSAYCGHGILYSYLQFYFNFTFNRTSIHHKQS